MLRKIGMHILHIEAAFVKFLKLNKGCNNKVYLLKTSLSAFAGKNFTF